MLRLLRTLTPGLLALCRLGAAHATTQAAPSGENVKQTNKKSYTLFRRKASSKKNSGCLLPLMSHSAARVHFRGSLWIRFVYSPLQSHASVMNVSRSTFLLVGLVSFFNVANSMDGHPIAESQVIGKKEITVEAYERWGQIEAPVLSPDGNWVVYTLSSRATGSELVVRATKGKTEFRIPQGPHLDTVVENESAYVTADSSFVIFSSGASSDRSTALGILRLSDGWLTTIPGSSTFIMPKNSGRHIAYKNGSAVILRDLYAQEETKFTCVSSYVFDHEGRYLAYTIHSDACDTDGMYVRRLEDGFTTSLLKGPGNYRSLTFDRSGQQIAFLYDHDEVERAPSRYTLYYSASPFASVEPVVLSSEIPSGFSISSGIDVQFVHSGAAITFALAPDQHSSALSQGQGDFDLWHWQAALPESYRNGMKLRRHQSLQSAVYHIASRRWTGLGSDKITDVKVTRDARFAIGADYSPYQLEDAWGAGAYDLYLIDTRSGDARPLRTRVWAWGYGNQVLSPNGKYLLYFENRRWFSYDFAKRRVTDLSGALLPDTRFDFKGSEGQPREPTPVGIAAWTEGDNQVFIYDQKGVWELDPTGRKKPRNLTESAEAGRDMVFRLWPHSSLEYILDWGEDEPVILAAGAPLVFTAHNRQNYQAEIWGTHVGSHDPPGLLLRQAKKLKPLARASGQYLLSQETFTEFPDLWVGSKWHHLERVSHANPQQHEYRWGRAEIVRWNSTVGTPLQGVLHTPEGLDRNRKYPMIVNLLGYDLHDYASPAPEGAAYLGSPVTYASRGYLVFRPEIDYAMPYIGDNALSAIVPAIQSLIDRGMVDRERIGLIGHSGGGYVVNYLITRSDLFRCAITGAGLSDMFSDYGSVTTNGRSQSGLYEHGTMLHGASIWENPFLYAVNSPFLYANRVRTPLLILHNQNDEAVSFSQGIELYVALRRNAKQAYLLNYVDEGHGIMRYRNRLDWSRRMREFFDYFLMGAAQPGWMRGRISVNGGRESGASQGTLSSVAAAP